MYIVFTPYACRIYTACTLYAHCVHYVCATYVLSMYTVYTVFLYHMYTVVTLYVHCTVLSHIDICCMKIKIERMAPLGTILINYHTVCTMSGSKVRMSLLQALKSLRVSDVKPYVVFVAAPNQQKLKDNITRTTGKEPTVSL